MASSTSTASHPDKVPLTAWLLLLLRDGESYGGALLGLLGERGIGADAGLAYRTLRALDGEGAITSRWTQSNHGPPRRSYRLTRPGRRKLDDLAARVAASRHMLETLLRTYEVAQGARAREQSTRIDKTRGPPPHRDEHAANTVPAPAVSRDHLTAWLLLVLEERETYGYGLCRALEQRDVHADPSALYRVLRALEREGRVQSRWVKPGAGPRRRFYRLTAEGRRHLAELVAAISGARDSLDEFLRAYEQPPSRRRARGT